MSGTSYVFDTNTLIEYLNGNQALARFHHTRILLSVITVVEFLSYSQIGEHGRKLFLDFLESAEVVDLKSDDIQLMDEITTIRIKFKIKLPDAIIAATALTKRAVLITNDKGFSKIDSLTVENY